MRRRWYHCAFITVVAACMASAEPVEVVDLASSTAWTATLYLYGIAGTTRPIIVPGGGYNSPTQPNPLSADNDSVVYSRSITIPASAAGRVVKLLFGAVTYGCDVYLNNTVLVGSHMGPMLPFVVDLTGKVTAGTTYQLKVNAYSMGHYKGAAPEGCSNWAFARGITKYVKLAVYPQIYIEDVFTSASVKGDYFSADAWVHNASAQSATVSLDGSFSSWNNDPWTYPVIPQGQATIAANTVAKIHIGPVRWGLGAKSYWWPNLPFREDYQARLHNLRLILKTGGATVDTLIRRFGFVEYSEGPYYYLINGVRVNHISDGTAEAQFGYDAYTTSAAWQPPSGPATGCIETLKRYMRLGVNTNRTHQSIPTEYMMQVADEVGFMFVVETAIRGWSQATWDDVSHPQMVREMVRFCRNNPSVVKYSTSNEMTLGNISRNEGMLIDAAFQNDTTRPIVVELSAGDPAGIRRGLTTAGHAYGMLHYQGYRGYPLRQYIIGMGEYAWKDWPPTDCGNGDLMREADEGLEMRKLDWIYFAIWTVTNYWPNLLPGVNRANFLHIPQRGDRTDGVDGWGSEQVLFLQRCLHPYVVCDSAIDEANRCYTANWPASVPSASAGSVLNRNIMVFNGGVDGSQFRLIWEARYDSPTSAIASTGITDAFSVQPGFHRLVPLSLTVPAASISADSIAVTQGRVVYKETRYNFSISSRKMYLVLKSVLLDDNSPTVAPPSHALRNSPAKAGMRVVNGALLVSLPQQHGVFRIDLTAADGKFVRSTVCGGGSTAAFSTHGLGAGVYYVRIGGNKAWVTHKVLVSGN